MLRRILLSWLHYYGLQESEGGKVGGRNITLPRYVLTKNPQISINLSNLYYALNYVFFNIIISSFKNKIHLGASVSKKCSRYVTLKPKKTGKKIRRNLARNSIIEMWNHSGPYLRERHLHLSICKMLLALSTVGDSPRVWGKIDRTYLVHFV